MLKKFLLRVGFLSALVVGIFFVAINFSWAAGEGCCLVVGANTCGMLSQAICAPDGTSRTWESDKTCVGGTQCAPNLNVCDSADKGTTTQCVSSGTSCPAGFASDHALVCTDRAKTCCVTDSAQYKPKCCCTSDSTAGDFKDCHSESLLAAQSCPNSKVAVSDDYCSANPPKNYLGTCTESNYYAYGSNPDFSQKPHQLQPGEQWIGFLPRCVACGNCQLNDILGAIVEQYRIIIAIFGSIALLFMVIGGFQLLIAAGNPEAVQRGTRMITSTVVGIIIILLSWMIINTLIALITGASLTAGGMIYGYSWNQPFVTPPAH